jgi:malonyl-CoA decarboxylase
MATTGTTGARTWIERLWSVVADRGERLVEMPDGDIAPPKRARLLAEAMLSERGEAAGAAVARELLTVMRQMSAGEALEFYHFLAAGFGPPLDKLRAAAEAYLAEASPESAMAIFTAAEPPRQELLRRMNMAPGGTAALVAMRVAVLAHMKSHPELRPLNADLQHLFISWFNRGFLQLQRIDWNTPAATLEKLIAYEAVHEIQGWDDLRRRLAPDRRCFAFFHPALPGEPLIFVEIALVNGLASSIQATLSAPMPGPNEPATKADTAIFYSISNCQEGLRGISFGNFLIKQVVEELKAEVPTLRQFSTLSPIPGLRKWLTRRLTGSTAADALRPEEIAALAAGGEPDQSPHDLIDAATSGEWWADPGRVAALHIPLMRLCCEYLTRPNKGMRGIDPVARFHLGNGARLERINWLGNVSSRGMQESFGLMVNYLYDPDTIEKNHETFVQTGAVVHAANLVPVAPAADASRSRFRISLSRQPAAIAES